MSRNFVCVLILMLAVVPSAWAAGGEKGDFELGAYAGLGFPDAYGTGVGRFNPDNDLLYGLRVGYFFTPQWSVELSGQQFSSTTQFSPAAATPDVDFDVNSYRFNLLYNFRPGTSLRPFLTGGLGVEQGDVGNLYDKSDGSYNLGGGLRWFLTDRFGLRLDGRYVGVNAQGVVDRRQQNFETALGVLWAFGGSAPGDADGDGVNDRKDKCPDTPRGAVVDKSGCPVDSDGDGVADGIDKCPDTPADMPVDARGCPRDSDGDGVPDGTDACPRTPAGARVDAKGCPIDSDGDGVPDGIDRCPDTPRGAQVDASGCPKDSDRDGVYDGIDKCPGTPVGATVDATGCPKDSDGDGVYDGVDKCPDTPRGTKVDAKGCKALFEERNTLVLEGVQFEFNKAVLTPQARTILDRVALSLNAWPETRVEIAGHTDSKGRDAYNLDLSGRRATSVMDYLMRRGVAAPRMTARGYGESRPIADNGTEAGRAKNRRVELNKLN